MGGARPFVRSSVRFWILIVQSRRQLIIFPSAFLLAAIFSHSVIRLLTIPPRERRDEGRGRLGELARGVSAPGELLLDRSLPLRDLEMSDDEGS